ncbi:nucleotidyltransferase family protein [Acidocella sp.]|uniref:nucleotidyltransferase family protein n=1 Tax=Acidocella sp. TaxID=50710 RepID=UPI002621214B|nr:nucleotidyltransferase domain-containing protein [Acidocella sp.]MDD2795504.1 nucleotidyltransferase domain-containing protein [Acidocella sp.]
MIDLTPDELSLVQKILRAQIPAAKVWVFGSRAKGTTKRASDLDLAIDTGAPLPPAVSAHLADAFDEAPLACNVDLVDLHNITPEFRALIDAHKIALPGFE